MLMSMHIKVCRAVEVGRRVEEASLNTLAQLKACLSLTSNTSLKTLVSG